MAKKTEPKRADPKKVSFEQAIERIEQGEIGLEESLAQRKRGEALIRRCRAILDAAEQELEQVTAGEGTDEEG